MSSKSRLAMIDRLGSEENYKEYMRAIAAKGGGAKVSKEAIAFALLVNEKTGTVVARQLIAAIDG